VIAAPASGHGKTTVATGLMAALTRAGHAVSGHKVGPDYIDPGYHALATGRPGRNLDPHLVGEERLVPLLLHGAAGADVAVIEGVMGLYDGQLGTDGFSSTAHVAAVTKSPVVLVVDISHASRSIAATVHGMATWGEAQVAGLVLNKAGSDRHAAEVVRALSDRYPVLGVLRRDDGIEAPSRHLGLVPAAERHDAAAALDRLAAQVAQRIDLDAILRLARTAPPLAGPPWSPTQPPLVELVETPAADSETRPVIAVAGGRAFTFAYAETTELLQAAGCEPVVFDPTVDEQLPPGTRGLYLGGGFPELHAADLSGNEQLRRQIREAVAAGMPTVAECAGLLYLCRSVDGVEMVGAVAADAAMAPRLTLAYRTAVAPTPNLLGRPGETVTGHEFHRTRLLVAPPDPAWSFGDDLTDGIATPTLHASYLHTHWAGHPQLAARFVEAVGKATPAADPAPARRLSLSKPGDAVADPLRHHGDQETGDGLLDFAVNVYDGPRPDWLEQALATADVGRYPDASAARSAIANRHGRSADEVLPTAGAAEAFGLVARLRPWRHPVVVHPQFTEPDVALTTAGHRPEHVILDAADGFTLDPVRIPAYADLVVIGNPTNPTGVRHPAASLRSLVRPGRLVVVDEAFLDDHDQTLAEGELTGLLVIRSLTKLWSIPGVRAGYLVAEPTVVAGLAALQTPWSVSAAAAAALVACSSEEAATEAMIRVDRTGADREFLLAGLTKLGVPHVATSTAPFVLAQPGPGVHQALREVGFAVRRADTFPGLDDTWVRIAVRNREVTARLLDALECIHQARGSRWESGTVALL
jgi:cobyrinic acid a,c-diamide synthase